MNQSLYRLSAIAFAAILSIAGTANAAFALQPYIAGYGKDGTNIANANSAYVMQYFTDEDGNNQINQDLLSVLSLAGSSGGTSGVSGFSYQAVVRWDINGYIYSDDQVWGPNQGGTAHGQQDELNEVQLVPKSQLSRITSYPLWNSGKTQVNFHHTIYKTDGTSFANNNWHTKDSWDTSTYFLFGECQGSACYSGNPSSVPYRFFQFGIEGETEANNFKVKQTGLRYVVGTSVTYLSSKDAYLVYGDSGSQNTWWTDNTGFKNPYEVGGTYYSDAYPKAQLTDGSYGAGTVEWDYTDCPGTRCVATPQQLW